MELTRVASVLLGVISALEGGVVASTLTFYFSLLEVQQEIYEVRKVLYIHVPVGEQ